MVSYRASDGFSESSCIFLKPPISYPPHQLVTFHTPWDVELLEAQNGVRAFITVPG